MCQSNTFCHFQSNIYMTLYVPWVYIAYLHKYVNLLQQIQVFSLESWESPLAYLHYVSGKAMLYQSSGTMHVCSMCIYIFIRCLSYYKYLKWHRSLDWLHVTCNITDRRVYMICHSLKHTLRCPHHCPLLLSQWRCRAPGSGAQEWRDPGVWG